MSEMEELVDGELEELGELLSRVTWDEEPDLETGIDDPEEDEDLIGAENEQND